MNEMLYYIRVKSSYDGSNYNIHSLTEEMARQWLWEMTEKLAAEAGYTYPPVTVESFTKTKP